MLKMNEVSIGQGSNVTLFVLSCIFTIGSILMLLLLFSKKTFTNRLEKTFSSQCLQFFFSLNSHKIFINPLLLSLIIINLDELFLLIINFYHHKKYQMVPKVGM